MACRSWLFAAVACAIALGCSNSDDEGADGSDGSAGSGGSGGAPSCPAKASACPSGCELISGTALDLDNGCAGEHQPLGCWAATGGNNAMYGCVKDPDTDISYLIPSTSYQGVLLGSGEWSSCPSGWMSATQPCP